MFIVNACHGDNRIFNFRNAVFISHSIFLRAKERIVFGSCFHSARCRVLCIDGVCFGCAFAINKEFVWLKVC